MKSLDRFLLALLFTISFSVHAQSPIIGGVLNDSVTHAPLSFATIEVYKNNIAQPINVIHSDESGKFSILLDTGSYIINYTHVGYAEKKLPINIINKESIDLQTIFLRPISTSLATVTISAKKPLIEQTDDKLIFNTTADPSTKTETALEILRKTPFVSVDGNDNILVNGQSSFRVLLNGRETGMFSQNASQALRSFPGASIIKIEVITNPSAKYDAEGVGGVINIVTQKKIIGYNGVASLNISSINVVSGTLTFNMKKDKVGIALNYNFNKIGLPGHESPPFLVYSKVDAINSQTYTSRISEGSTNQRLFQNFGNAEISYDIDSLKTLSIYGSIAGGYNNLLTSTSIKTFFPTTTSTSYFILQNNIENPNYNIGSDFIKKFKEIPEKEFSIKLYTEYSKNNSFLNSYQDNPDVDRYLINNNYANNTQTTIQTDYILPLKAKQKLETGLKLILRNATSDYESLTKTTPTDTYKLVPGNTNNFNYAQQVYSAYSSYNFLLKKWLFRIGLRVEHTEVDGNFKSTGTAVSQSYTNWIPNIQTVTQITEAYRIVLSYGQRIQRPFINNLNPFINNNDTLNISFGNPQLNPQLIHSLALQNNFSKGKVFVGLTLIGSYSNDKIIQISSFNKTTGITTTVSENLGRESQLSLNGNITITVNKAWNLLINTNLQYTSLQNISNSMLQNNGLSGSFGISNTLRVSTKFTVSTFFGNSKPPIGLQGHTSSQWFYNITSSYKFFNDKLAITIAAARFISKYVTVKTVQRDINFNSENLNSFQAINFRLGIVWNFGKLTEKVSKKKGINNDDML